MLEGFEGSLEGGESLESAESSLAPFTHTPKHTVLLIVQKVGSLTKSLPYCLLLLIETLSERFCGGVDLLELIHESIASDKDFLFTVLG